jgi:Zn-dependent protease/CBS domain-containing protein
VADRTALAGGFYLGTLLGVRVHADWSVLVVFVLILVNLGAGLFPAWHPEWSPMLAWGTALGSALLFFASILAHELSHAIVARKNGIPVARITLFLFGGLAHMEGEPPSPRSEFLMAAVGPLTSFAIGALALLAGFALAGSSFWSLFPEDPRAALSSVGPLATLLLWLGPINLWLALFNVVPGFPLDGGRMFRSVMWWITGDLRKATRWASAAGRAFAWILIGWGVMSLFRGSALEGLWLMLIGWFLNNAARASYQQVVLKSALQEIPLSSVMRTRFSTLHPGMDLETLVREELMASDQRAFPVVDPEGRLVGLVSIADVRKVPAARWSSTRAADVMTPLGELTTLPPDAPADRALEALARRGVDQVPVVVEERPVGLVRSQDLLKWLSLNVGGTPRASLQT